MSEQIINVAKEFTDRPFGRFRKDDNERSGEVFREDMLIPALKKHERVIVDLSGSNFYSSSFLEEVFGGLIRSGFKKGELDKKLEIHHKKLPSLAAESLSYIKDAATSKSWTISR